jgi:hypothetical protein
MTRPASAAAFLAVLLASPALQGRPGGEELRPGLVGEYYSLGAPIEGFPAIREDRKPGFKRVDRRICFEQTEEGFGKTKLVDYFFVRWTGLLRAPRDGKYRFFTETDDGSRLWVAGILVVENGGDHAMTEQAGEVELKAGDHPIRIEFYENSGVAGCIVSWDPPGRGKEVIPEDVLFHPKDKSPTEEEVRRIERRDEAPKPEAPKTAAAGGERPPDLAGRVMGVFEDDPLTLLVIRRGGAEVPVYTDKSTRVVYAGILREGRRPTVGYSASVWLRPDAADTAESVRFEPAKK